MNANIKKDVFYPAQGKEIKTVGKRPKSVFEQLNNLKFTHKRGVFLPIFKTVGQHLLCMDCLYALISLIIF